MGNNVEEDARGGLPLTATTVEGEGALRRRREKVVQLPERSDV